MFFSDLFVHMLEKIAVVKVCYPSSIDFRMHGKMLKMKGKLVS